MTPFPRLREFNGVVQDHTARKVASQSSSDSKRQEEYLGSGRRWDVQLSLEPEVFALAS